MTSRHLFIKKLVSLSLLTALILTTFVFNPASADEDRMWKDKFSDHFTDEVIVTENSYSSPDISIKIDYFNEEKFGTNRIYYIADIYISDISCIRTYTKDNTLIYGQNGLTDIALLDTESNAILSTNADDYSIQPGKLFYRNGVVTEGNCYGSLCVLYNDGVMETYNSRRYNYDELKERGIWQIWCFGPALLDSEGHAFTEDVMDYPSYSIEGDAPRTAIGYYEPGHYCLIVSEGRSESCKGFRTGQLAKLCEELGLTQAYNLDGGRSSTMIFNHEQLNTRSNGGSNIADIICIVEPDSIVEGPIS